MLGIDRNPPISEASFDLLPDHLHNAFDRLGWYLFFKVSPFVIHLIRWNLSANRSIYAIIRKCLYVTSPFPFQNLTNFRMRYFTSIFFLLRYPSASQLLRRLGYVLGYQ
jgi:hypothetical protein